MDALVWAPRQMTWVDGSLPITMNVRTGPGTDYEVAAVVPQGTQARIYGTDPVESWFLVEMEGYSSLYWLYR